MNVSHLGGGEHLAHLAPCPLFSVPIPLFFRWRERKQRDESGKRGILLFRFLTSNENEKYQSKIENQT
jgi:hypothetical protein